MTNKELSLFEAKSIDPDFSNDIDEAIALETLVGEGKKFKDTNSLAVSKIKADQFIEQLKAENATYRKQLEEKKTMEDFLNGLRNSTDPSNAGNTNSGETEEKVQNQSVSTEDIINKVLAEMSDREKAKLEKNNLETVKRNMSLKFGADWQKKVRQIAEENDIPQETLEDLAKRSPTGFEKVLGLTAKRPDASEKLFDNSLDSAKFFGNVNKGTRNFKFYEEIRKKDPKRYSSKDVQVQMHNDALKMGSSFFE